MLAFETPCSKFPRDIEGLLPNESLFPELLPSEISTDFLLFSYESDLLLFPENSPDLLLFCTKINSDPAEVLLMGESGVSEVSLKLDCVSKLSIESVSEMHVPLSSSGIQNV